MTNPPFGAMVKRVTPKSNHPYLDSYKFGKGRNSQKTEVLFLERCIELLEPGGRMGIVLPEGILNNDRALDVRQYMEDRCYVDTIVSLPQETFVATGASVKTSVLIFQKFTAQEVARYTQEKATANAEIIKKYAAQKQALESDYELRIACYDRDDLVEVAKRLLETKRRLVASSNKKLQKELATTVRGLQKTLSEQANPVDVQRRDILQKELDRRLKQLEEVIQSESRELLKSRVNYPVFVAHADHVGITATGQADRNELPDVLAEYKQFRASTPLAFLPPQ
jgi:type I restriction enzyme M protein